MEGFFKRNFGLHLGIAAPPWARLVRLPCAAEAALPEQRAEKVRERAFATEHVLQVFRRHRARVGALARLRFPLTPIEAAATAAALLPLLVLGAHRVVFFAPLLVAQRLVGFADILEAILRLFVARVHVWVVLARQLAIRSLNCLLIGIRRHAQNSVIIFK